jgi:hypothetical protein
MKRISLLACLMLCLSFQQPLFAASAGTAKAKPKVVYEKESVIRFDDAVIEGNIVKPDGFFLLRQRPKRWQDLIRIRENFDPELKEMKYEF